MTVIEIARSCTELVGAIVGGLYDYEIDLGVMQERPDGAMEQRPGQIIGFQGDRCSVNSAWCHQCLAISGQLYSMVKLVVVALS